MGFGLDGTTYLPDHVVVLGNVEDGGRVEVRLSPLHGGHHAHELLLELPVLLVPLALLIVAPVVR